MHSGNSLTGALNGCILVVLCSKTTPESYLTYLKERDIDYIIAGEERIDLREALTALSDSLSQSLRQRYDIKKVQVNRGGTLNGVLLRQNLVNKINLLIHPYLVGGTTVRSILWNNGSLYISGA